MPESLRRIWELLSSDEYLDRRRNTLPFEVFRLPMWLSDGRLNPTARQELLRQFRPVIRLEPRSIDIQRLELEAGAEVESERPLSGFVSADVGLVAGDLVELVVDSIYKDPKRRELLADLADELTSLLKETLEAFASIGRADENRDPSHYDEPSIAPHGQNQHFKEWSYLIDLVRESCNSLLELNATSADALIERWKSIPYPTFKRLILHAVTEWTLRQR